MAYPANRVWNVPTIQLSKYGFGKLYLGFEDAGPSGFVRKSEAVDSSTYSQATQFSS